jgi:hypothetical protein
MELNLCEIIENLDKIYRLSIVGSIISKKTHVPLVLGSFE